MAKHDDPPTAELDPVATDVPTESGRNGAEKRRDPNEPSAVVGIGASAGGIAPLQQFFEEMKPDTGLAFVVVMHLSPDFESQLGKAVVRPPTEDPIWQRGFFDHVLRSDESYAEKWNYVRENPVRAGRVSRAEDWPYAGEIVYINK